MLNIERNFGLMYLQYDSHFLSGIQSFFLLLHFFHIVKLSLNFLLFFVCRYIWVYIFHLYILIFFLVSEIYSHIILNVARTVAILTCTFFTFKLKRCRFFVFQHFAINIFSRIQRELRKLKKNFVTVPLIP